MSDITVVNPLARFTRIGVGEAVDPSIVVVVTQPSTGVIGQRIQMPTGALNTASALRVTGYSPAIEFLDKDAAQNWYVGLDDDAGNRFVIGRGFGPGQGILPNITISPISNWVTIGKLLNAYPSETAAVLSVVSGTDLAPNDAIAWFRRDRQADDSLGESLIRHQHFGGSTFAGQPIFAGISARGSIQTPTTVQSGDPLLIIDGRGYDGTVVSDTASQMKLLAAQAWTATKHGSEIDFFTTPLNSITPANHFSINSEGDVQIQPTSPRATTAVAGFPFIPSCNGTPTGVPTLAGSSIPLIYDTANNRLYAYNGAWKVIQAS